MISTVDEHLLRFIAGILELFVMFILNSQFFIVKAFVKKRAPVLVKVPPLEIK
jgi:hypothetical protein